VAIVLKGRYLCFYPELVSAVIGNMMLAVQNMATVNIKFG